MKKSLFNLIISFGLLAGLTGCGGNNPTSTPAQESQSHEDTSIVEPTSVEEFEGEEVNLTFWNPITGPDAAYMQDLVASFNKLYAGKINVNSDAQAEATHYTRITTSFTDSSSADICLVHKSRVSSFHRAGRLRNLDSFVDSIGLLEEDYVGDTWTSCQLEDSMYALPYDVLPTIIFYNRKLIPAGYTEDDILADDFTIEKMEEMMKAAYVHAPMTNRRTYGMSFNYSYTEAMFVSFLNQQGAKVVDSANPTLPTYDCQEGYNAAEAVRSIPFTLDADGNKVSSESGADHLNIFTQGRALFTIDGIWSAPSACQKREKVDAGVALMPKVNESANRSVCSDGHVFVSFNTAPNQSSHKDEAISIFIKYLIDNSSYWCQGGKVAARRDCVEQESYKNLEWGYLSENLEKIVSPVKTYTYNAIVSPIGVEVAKLCEGTETDIQKAVKAAASSSKQLAEAIA